MPTYFWLHTHLPVLYNRDGYMKQFLLLWFALSILTLPASAQQRQMYGVSGTIVDADDETPLPGVTVFLQSLADSTTINGGITNTDGRFRLRSPRPGTYRLRFSYVGYETHFQEVVLEQPRQNLGIIPLKQTVLGIDEIVVEEAQERFRMRGDTTIFNADAYKVNPDATAEHLVEKMPGVVYQDGELQAQGETVQRVTVDGREFFGSDPTVALRNLPADIIQNVEIFDRQSDQAQFTGFNDGNTERTINIVTRRGMSNGQFGKVYSGLGADVRYATGGNANYFSGDRQISIIGLSNNINQQNFAFEDLLGISAGNARGGPRGPRMRSGGRRGSDGGGGRGGRGRGGGSGFNPRDFLVGQQGGLNNTSSVGINYSDKAGDRFKVNGSYFFNRMENSNDALLDREFFLPGEQSQLYNETTQSNSTNYNHRLSARIEYQFDENNSLLIRPRLSFQDNTAASLQNGFNLLDTGVMLNDAFNTYATENFGYTSSTDMLYRHRFPKRGRTISAAFQLGLNDRWGDTDQFSITEFFEDNLVAEDSTYDQRIDSETASQSYSFDIDYTEPIGENAQLRLSYEPSYGKNISDRFSYVRDLQTGLYTILDPTFSSQFDNKVYRQRGGLSFRKDLGERLDVQVGIEAQNEQLLGDQSFPTALNLDRSFFSILPEVEIDYRVGRGLVLDLDYRTSTNTPSVNQLQNVIDNSNPLFLTNGNPDLEPSYSHSIRLRGRRGNWREGRLLFGFMSFSYQRNPIGTASLLAVQDTLLAPNVLLQQGAQFSYPVNLTDPNINVRSVIGVGTPFPLLRSNLNIRGGLTYARTPGLINGAVNMASLYALNGGFTLGSNISERLDFTISYGADYTIASNSFFEQLDENYFRHNSRFRFTWLPLGAIILESSLTYNEYVGLDEELYPTTFIMNAGIGYKFLKQDAAELKLVVGDIFNQENGISRSITEMYVENSQTQVLGRYVLLNLSFRFRNFRR